MFLCNKRSILPRWATPFDSKHRYLSYVAVLGTIIAICSFLSRIGTHPTNGVPPEQRTTGNIQSIAVPRETTQTPTTKAEELIAGNETTTSHQHCSPCDKFSDRGYEISDPGTNLSSTNVSQYLDRFVRDLKIPIPHKYNSIFKNPCWYNEGEPQTGQAIRNNKSLLCLPYFFLAGFPKTGTSELYDKITSHAQVLNPSLKEPHWWTRYRFRGASFEKYLSTFNHAASEIQAMTSTRLSKPYRLITGDFSASTAWDNWNWMRFPGNEGAKTPRIVTSDYIHHLLPKARIIIVLRNPVTRLLSEYLYSWTSRDSDQSKTPTAQQFHTGVLSAIRMLEHCCNTSSLRTCVYSSRNRLRVQVGIYAVYLEDWLRIYPRHQIHFVRTETYAAQPREELAKIFSFLRLDALADDKWDELLNSPSKNVGSRSLEILEETLEVLARFYRPFNRRLAKILGDSSYLWEDVSVG